MRKILFGMILQWLLLSSAAIATASSTPNDIERIRDEMRAIDKTVAILEEGTKNKLDAQDKRIGDLGLATAQQANFMGAIANQTTNVGYLITLILFIGGLAAYFTATRHAAKEAKETAKKWMEEHERDLRAQIDALKAGAQDLRVEILQLREQAGAARRAIDQHKAEVTDHAANVHAVFDNLVSRLPSSVPSEDQTSGAHADETAVHMIHEVSQALESKPEREFTSEDHFTRGFNEYLANRFDSALVSFDKALEHAQTEKVLPTRHARIMFARALALGGIGRDQEEIAAYEEIDQAYGANDDPTLREQVATALVNKGFKLGQVGRTDDEIAVYREVDRRYGSDHTLALRKQVARALCNRATTFGKSGLSDDAITDCDEIDKRYGEDYHPSLREVVARALYNKGGALKQLGHSDHAVQVYGEIDKRYSMDDRPAQQKTVARALVQKGNTLTNLGHYSDAIATYSKVEQRYGANDNPAICEITVGALNGRAFCRVLSAKRVWRHETERRDLLTLAIKDLDRAQLNSEEAGLPMVLGNLGYARFLAGEVDQALEPTRECLRLGGLKSLEAQRKDAQTERIEPQDSEYEALLDQLWRELHPEV